MINRDLMKRIDALVSPYRITSGKGFKLDDIDPSDTGEFKSDNKNEAEEWLNRGIELLRELQGKLYAQDRWAILCIFQAMDAAGKDGTIGHVMSGVNPQGVHVSSFKQPSNEELDHDYMWRYSKCLPERGRIGIFNRSYYEEVLVVRVHKEIMEAQKLPEKLVSKRIWSERLEDMRNFELYLARNGILPIKFYLHLSRKEQKKRFLSRINTPEKNWKFSMADVKERQYWDKYMKFFEEAIKETATKHAPWYVVPADNKWYTRLVVAAAIVESLEKLDVDFPKLGEAQMASLAEAEQALLAEK